ncbi:helix-turn-helix domain-containing protein [Piscibacillus sp. B03]|uniref:helix-turn-helix domain-containing protein n=1 Tax=Piscibacillus sp. B03 TaxID=3457430 RepID=UPI003FCD9D6E
MLLVKEKSLMDGARLKRLRKEKKLTQAELGEIINVSKVSISGYESGDRTPDTDNLRRMADYFEVTTDYLLGRTDNPKGYETDFDPIAEHNRLLKKYGIEDSGFFDIEKWKQMGPEELKQLEDYFEFIVSKAKEKNKDSE